MVSIKEDGKVEISLAFTTVETAQLISIATSMISLAWCYSEYHSVRNTHTINISYNVLYLMYRCARTCCWTSRCRPAPG